MYFFCSCSSIYSFCLSDSVNFPQLLIESITVSLHFSYLFVKELATGLMVGCEWSTTSQTAGLHSGNAQKSWCTQLQELQASPESSLGLI